MGFNVLAGIPAFIIPMTNYLPNSTNSLGNFVGLYNDIVAAD